MTCEVVKRMSVWVIGMTLALGGCGSATPVAEPVTARQSEIAPSAPASPTTVAVDAAAPAPRPEPVESAGFAEAMTLLRPAAAAEPLAALERTPHDASAYAAAAVAFSTTDVPVMTLVWGLTYQAMGGGKDEAEVARALHRVLTERVTVRAGPNNDRVDYQVRLAPGQMPTRRDASGTVQAPFAHAFEGLFSPTLMGFRPPWTIEDFYDVLSSWVGVISTRGTPLDDELELHGWLVALAKAGHLEAFCYRVLGAALPGEMKAYRAGNARELQALSAYVEESALKPTRAAVPDALVRLN